MLSSSKSIWKRDYCRWRAELIQGKIDQDRIDELSAVKENWNRHLEQNNAHIFACSHTEQTYADEPSRILWQFRKTVGIAEMAASIYAPEWLMLIGSTMEFLTVLPRGKLHATVYGSFLTGSVQSLEWQYIGVQGLYWLMLSEASPKT